MHILLLSFLLPMLYLYIYIHTYIVGDAHTYAHAVPSGNQTWRASLTPLIVRRGIIKRDWLVW